MVGVIAGRVNNVVVAADQRELTRPAVREKDYDFFSADRVAGALNTIGITYG